MDAKLNSVAARLPAEKEWPSALTYGPSGWVEGASTSQTEIFRAAGLRNAAVEAGFRGYVQVSEEQVLAMEPDYLVLVEHSINMQQQKHWLTENPALAPLKAIREQRFLTLNEALLSTVSHRIADAVAELARQVHADRFSDAQQ
jgi:iron complex transport system substrate-binding protein